MSKKSDGRVAFYQLPKATEKLNLALPRLIAFDLLSIKQFLIFSDILERNNNYSDTLDFRRKWVGEVTFFVLKVPDYE